MRYRSMPVIALLLLLGTAPGTLAQDATPSAVTGEAIDPAECQVTPRPVDDLIDLWSEEDETGTPVVVTPKITPPPTAIPVPLGERADAGTVAGVNATMRGLLACSNAGDITRYFAFLSDNMLMQHLPEAGETSQDTRQSVESDPEPVPVDQRSQLVAVTNVAVMKDDRTGALVTTIEPQNAFGGPETVLALFVEVDGQWLVDEVIAFFEADTFS
jgi:hypothetical protein